MKETLHCPGILGQASYRYSSEQLLKFFPRCINFLLLWLFLSKNSSKVHSQRPKTMKKPCIVLVLWGKASYR